MGIYCPVSFEEAGHVYTDKEDGFKYKSVSGFLAGFKEEFDKKGISKNIALSTGVSQSSIIAEWDKKRDDAILHGNTIHKELEDYAMHGKCSNPMIAECAKEVEKIIGPYYRSFAEIIFWNKKYRICGTSDRSVLRCNTPNAILDIFDYKTNLERGIYFSSSKYDKYGNYKHYKKFYFEPISHLEDCNYNHYALQLSTYAYMAMLTYGVKIGRLGLIFIRVVDGKYIPEYIPVPFLLMEVKAMLDFNHKLKALPAIEPKRNFISAEEY